MTMPYDENIIHIMTIAIRYHETSVVSRSCMKWRTDWQFCNRLVIVAAAAGGIIVATRPLMDVWRFVCLFLRATNKQKQHQ
jgi:hypothetical protein